MEEVNGGRLYQWGAAIQAISHISDNISAVELMNRINNLHEALKDIERCPLDLSVAEKERLSLWAVAGDHLPTVVEAVANGGTVSPIVCLKLKAAAERFETILLAALDKCDTLSVREKMGMRTSKLLGEGLSFFHSDLEERAPNAVNDLKAFAKCFAFEMFTAAAFHLHRANEAVLRTYYSIVAHDLPKPKRLAMGDYLNELAKNNRGSEELRAALKNLKDLHRNFIAHPDLEITDVDEIHGLYCQISAVIGCMIKEMKATT